MKIVYPAHSHRSTGQLQRGVAVVLVMLIVAMATTVAVYISQQQSLWQRQVSSQFDHTQARRLGITGIDWARAVLADDGANSKIDYETEIWTLRLPPMPVDNGKVIGVIEDRQGRFNLNSVVRNGISSPPDIAKLQRLLTLLDLPTSLALALADWIDADSQVQAGGGAEDSYYLSLQQPCLPANQPLVELGELARIKGFDTKVIARLEPYVSVLPIVGVVNVNFAPAEVLVAISSNLSLADARIIVQQRRGNPYQSIADFRSRLPNSSIQFSDLDISVSSYFFWVTGRASVNNSQVTTRALLQRSQGWPAVVWQSIE